MQVDQSDETKSQITGGSYKCRRSPNAEAATGTSGLPLPSPNSRERPGSAVSRFSWVWEYNMDYGRTEDKAPMPSGHLTWDAPDHSQPLVSRGEGGEGSGAVTQCEWGDAQSQRGTQGRLVYCLQWMLAHLSSKESKHTTDRASEVIRQATRSPRDQPPSRGVGHPLPSPSSRMSPRGGVPPPPRDTVHSLS